MSRFAFVLGAMVLTAAGQALAADPPAAAPSPAHGREVFEYWCAPCHSSGPGHPGTDALAAKYKGEKPGELEKRADLKADQVSLTVRGGVSVMPIFRKTEVSDEDLADIGAYLQKAAPKGRRGGRGKSN